MAFQNTCRNFIKAHRYSRLFSFSTSEVKNVTCNKYSLMQKNPYVRFFTYSKFCARSFTLLHFAGWRLYFLCARSDIYQTSQRYWLEANLNCTTQRYCTKTGKYNTKMFRCMSLKIQIRFQKLCKTETRGSWTWD